MNLREVGLRLPLPASAGSMDSAAREGGEAFILPMPPERAPSRVASTPARDDAAQARQARQDGPPRAGDEPSTTADGKPVGESTARTAPSGEARQRDRHGAGTQASAPSGPVDPTDPMPPSGSTAAARAPASGDAKDAGTTAGTAEAPPTAAVWLLPATPAAPPISAPVAAAHGLSPIAAGTIASPLAKPGMTAAASPGGALPAEMTASRPDTAAQAAAVLPGLPAAAGAAGAATLPPSGSSPRPMATPSASADALHAATMPVGDGRTPATAADGLATAATRAPLGPLSGTPPVLPPAAPGPEAFAALVALSTQAGRSASTDERTGDALAGLTGADSALTGPTTSGLAGSAPVRIADPAPVVVPGTVALPASPDAGFDDAFGDKVVWIVEQRLTQAEIRVSPDGLGAIEVRLQLDGNKLSAQFAAAHPDVRQALEAGMGRLRDLLGQHGMQLADSHVGQQHGGDRPPARHARGDEAEGDRPALVTNVGGLRARGLIDLYA